MTTLFTLSLKASLILMLLYPVFCLMVHRCRSFQFNRMCMLAGIAIVILAPIVLPMLPGRTELPIEDIGLPSVAIEASAQPDVQWSGRQSVEVMIASAICLYWLGILMLLIREAIAYIRLACIIRKSRRASKEGYIMCTHGDQRLAPFSWGRYIVLADDEIEPAIIAHEKAHTAQRHWIDVAIADLFCIFLWYNPFSWMLRNLIKLNHEYDADAKVIASDIDILSYQRLLIAKAAGKCTLPIANNFAMSKRDFRKRVLSLSHPQSPKKMRWIVLLAIPAVAIAAYANATPFSTSIFDSFSAFRFGHVISYGSNANHIAEETASASPAEMPVIKMTAATIVTERIPSPLTDPEPLLKKFKVSIDAADKDLLPDMIVARIEADEDGNIVHVTTDHDANPAVRVAVDRATNGLRFEVVEENGKKISIHFAIPIKKSQLPY